MQLSISAAAASFLHPDTRACLGATVRSEKVTAGKTRLKPSRSSRGGGGCGGVGSAQAARMVQALTPTAPNRKSSPAQHAPSPGDDKPPHPLRDSSKELMYWKNEALSPLPEGSKILSEGLPAKQVHTLISRILVSEFSFVCVFVCFSILRWSQTQLVLGLHYPAPSLHEVTPVTGVRSSTWQSSTSPLDSCFVSFCFVNLRDPAICWCLFPSTIYISLFPLLSLPLLSLAPSPFSLSKE